MTDTMKGQFSNDEAPGTAFHRRVMELLKGLGLLRAGIEDGDPLPEFMIDGRLTGDVWKNWRSGRSRPSPAQINSVALLLARNVSEGSVDGATSPFSNFHLLLNDLFSAARQPVPIRGSQFDVAFEEIFPRHRTGRPIRVGVFEWPPMARRAPRDLMIGEVAPSNKMYEMWQGLAIDIVVQICRLLNVEYTFTPVAWPGVYDDVDSGKVDCIAPLYLRTPFRMRSILFSNPLPYFRAILNGVYDKSFQHEFALESSQPSVDHRPWNHRMIVMTPGLSPVGQTLARLLEPRSEIELDRLTGEPVAFGSITAGWQGVIERPLEDVGLTVSDRNRVRVFPTECLTVAHAMKTWPERVSSLYPLTPRSTAPKGPEDKGQYVPDENKLIGLGVCMAVSDSEPRLLELLNLALEEISRHESNLAMLYRPYFHEYLKTSRALSKQFEIDHNDLLVGT